MSSENIQRPYQQRFKGVENFLRRVAFNLGNTASQTEVKIISCIPIDVTDLQQKIINLEKQLHEAQVQASNATEKVIGKHKTSEKPVAVVNTALYGSTFAKQSSTVSYCSNKPINKIKSGQVAAYCGDWSSRAKKSNVSFVFPALSEPDAETSGKFHSNKDLDNENFNTVNRCKNIFRTRKKKFSKKPKLKTHLVYYAHQTGDNPFKINNLRLNHQKSLSSTDKLCLSHLNNLMRRQYDPNEVVEEFSDTSHFTRPMCREIGHNQHESDVCSCCHGRFQNIDNYMTNTFYCESIVNKLHHSLSNTEAFYNSNNYDIIPVKEKVSEVIKEKTVRKKKQKMNLEMKCRLENLRTKQRYHPFIMNYEAKGPINQGCSPTKTPEKMIKQKIKQMQKNGNKNTDQKTGIEISGNCCIDCGDMYRKKTKQKTKTRNAEPSKAILQINESVATDNIVIKMQGVNQSTQLELNSTDDSKILTLNEIKATLQCVLKEIKTSTMMNASERKVKKDAVVQKGASENSVEADSVLLHSYTHNKSYIASCSRLNPYGQYCFPSVPYQPRKCLQNFPVFIQPALGRHTCTCYYCKSCSKPTNKQAATATSNSNKEIKKTSSKETGKLIKEIYKSIALNMDYSTKDVSSSEYHNPTSSEDASTKLTNKEDTKNEEVTSKRDIQVEALISPFQLHVNQSKLMYTAASAQSEDKSQRNEQLSINQRIIKEIANDRILRKSEYQSTDTIVEDEEVNDFSSETESDETVILEEFKRNVRRKKGFFNRILTSVKLFKKKKEIEKHHSDIDETSDSDYETIYSGPSQGPAKAHEKQYSKVIPGKSHGRSPYLEQEYRRQWNEYLMFRDQEESKHSSERPHSRQSRSKPRPVYWRNYEARSAIVDHEVPIFNKKQNIIQISKENNLNGPKERLGWLRKHKFGVNCGQQWNNFILEN